MELKRQMKEYVHACFTGIWIESHEPDEVIGDLASLSHEEAWQLAIWDIDQGLHQPGETVATETPASNDPLSAIRSLPALSQPGGTAVLVLRNFHRFLQSTEIIQALERQIHLGKQQRTFVVILAPIVQLPAELEKLFVVIEHELPGREQLREIAQGIATEPGDFPEEEAEQDRVLNAAAGLTRYEAEGAFSLSLVREGSVRPETIWGIKGQQLRKSGLVSLHRGGETFDQLGGLASLKAFCTRALRSGLSHPKARGVLLLGVPGTGKSAIAKALGNEVGRPTLILDMGRLLGSLVGQSEANIRQALKIIDAMQPAVVMIDEVEKALAGATSGGQNDSGVSSRLFGTFLTWLNDHESDVFVICTSNDVSKLPPEFTRAERFDGVFFLDLPSQPQRDCIWAIYEQHYAIDADQARPLDEGWTGAEIKACCRLAALLDLPLTEAAKNIVPIAATASESVSRLWSWASGRCLDADKPGVYRHAASPKRRRNVAPTPSDN